MNRKSHWENVYQTKDDRQVSWYLEHLGNSMQLILDSGVGKDAAIIDVGGGSSTLADDLLATGFSDVSVLDISAAALARSRARLGVRSGVVDWIEADITKASLPENRYDIWHDRAVFHFLTDPDDRRAYVELVKRSVKPGGHAIVASFGLSGPKKCSGLDVVRYSHESMHSEFGVEFQLAGTYTETHETPFGTTQDFIYCYCQRRP
ncbi:MAG: class I SAM-dependent methyltransferase [Acidobacteria bacterium]|nr:class I SAM-dependent methyltransferase [Acidobacteriota bacterium]